ncbi:MAG TPA: GNAT family N-acetyltransferase [Jatrophihabitans sp.]|jgi:GNAT superfamily N-acetyltransferase
MFESSNDVGPDDLPFRSGRTHTRCLNGHVCDVAGSSNGYDHTMRLATSTCELCRTLRLPRDSWFVIDHRPEQHPGVLALRADNPVQLTPRAPRVRGGVGRIELSVRGTVWAYVDVQLCGIERRGVLVYLAVDGPHRRRGLGRVLLDAALARGPGYTWSTVKFDEDDVTLRAFRATAELPESVQVREPFFCSHMLEANGEGI